MPVTLIQDSKLTGMAYDGHKTAAIGSYCHEERNDGDMSYVEASKASKVLVYMTLCLFGIGAYIAIHATWIEIPVLEARLPEEYNLPYYILVLLQMGNFAPLAYVLARKCKGSGISEVPFIYASLGTVITVVMLMGLFWRRTNIIFNESHSVVFLTCSFLVSLITCMSPITYILFASRLKARYISGILTGEALGALLPHVLAVAQGITGGPPVCDLAAKLAANNITYEAYKLKQPSVPVVGFPWRTRFSVSVYFFIHGAILSVSAVAFILLRHIPRWRSEYEPVEVQCPDDLELYHMDNRFDEHEPEERWQWDGYTLDDGSFRQTSRQYKSYSLPRKDVGIPNHHGAQSLGGSPRRPRSRDARVRDSHHVRLQSSTSTDSKDRSYVSETTTSEIIRPIDVNQRPPSFQLLMFITLWSNAVIHGPLSTSKAYACLPVGNTAFMIGVLLANVLMPITCFGTIQFTAKRKVAIVVAFTSLGTILLTYFVALMAFSRGAGTPIFGNAGELLATIAWVAILGLFSVTRATTAVICRSAGKESMIWFGGMSQLGAAIGAICLIKLVSICQVFRSFDKPCEKLLKPT